MAKIVLLGNPDASETTKHWLVAEGHDVRIAQTGADAIDLGYLFEPDVVVTDWRLKCEYDGIEVATAMQVANRRVKTILITECSVGAAMHVAAPSNIFQIIMKPVSKSAMLRAVVQALAENAAVIS